MSGQPGVGAGPDRGSADRRRGSLLAAVAAIVVAAVALAAFLIVQNANQPKTVAVDAGQAFDEKGVIAMPAPAGASAVADGAPTVRLYSDYLCGHCADFEKEVAGYLTEQQQAGAIKREYVPVSILGQGDPKSYPSRGAAAAFCVADADVSRLGDFNEAMFAAQDGLDAAGLTDAQILGLAKKSIPDNATMDSCITAQRYLGFVGETTDAASRDGMRGTPTVMIDGEILRPQQGDTWLTALQRGIEAAAK